MGFPDSIADLAQVLTGIVRAHWIHDERSVPAYGDAGLQGGHLLDGGALSKPLDGHVAGQGLRLAIELDLFALQLGLIGGRHHDNGAARDDNARRMRDLAFAIASDARVVADVFVSYVGDTQLGAVVKYTCNNVEKQYRERESRHWIEKEIVSYCILIIN